MSPPVTTSRSSAPPQHRSVGSSTRDTSRSRQETRICVYGAGAVGGHIAGRLAARRRRGLADRPRCTTRRDPPAAGCGSKPGPASGVPPVRHRSARRPGTPGRRHRRGQGAGASDHRRGHRVAASPGQPGVFVRNGIPWWYFHSHGGTSKEPSCDGWIPTRRCGSASGPERTVGAVAYTACTRARTRRDSRGEPQQPPHHRPPRRSARRPPGHPGVAADHRAAWRSPSPRRSVTPSGRSC